MIKTIKKKRGEKEKEKKTMHEDIICTKQETKDDGAFDVDDKQKMNRSLPRRNKYNFYNYGNSKDKCKGMMQIKQVQILSCLIGYIKIKKMSKF